MRTRSLFLLLAAALTLLALVFLAPTQTWVKALLGFQLPALWTLLAMVGIFRSTRGEQPVAAALYATLGVTLANFLYFAMVFTGGHTG
jgi:hypothetical protein